MGNFLSCDWGTSSFRIRLADNKTGDITAEEVSEQGIASAFLLWTATGRDTTERTAFYLNLINDHVKKLAEKVPQSLNSLPVIISGMASSNIGIINIPYSSIPVDVNKPTIQTAFIKASVDFDHDVWIVSGIKSDDDVIRGEETQLLGCIDPSAEIADGLFIFPGTHSKHIHVKNNQVIGFKTFMTGDLFELLSQKSMLKASVEKHPLSEDNLESFKKGVKDAVTTNLLNAIFKVRTNDLLRLLDKRENFDYLSGLLIGTELKDLQSMDTDTVHLVCGSNLATYYNIALSEIGLLKTIEIYPMQWVDEAVVRGQIKIAKQLNIFV